MRKPPAPALSQIYDQLFPENGKGPYIVAAIIDPSLWPELDEHLRYHSPEWSILFDKKPPAELVQVLPRIVRLEPDAVFTGIVLAEYGKRRNIYLRAEQKKKRPDICDLASALKAFANVKLPGNEWSWLRYYDPVVFSHLMQVGTDPQKKYLFGPHIASFFAESVWEGEVQEFAAPDAELPPEKPIVFTPGQKEKFDELHYHQFKRALTDYILTAYFPNIEAEKQVKAISVQIHEAVDLSQEYGAVQKNQCLEFVKLGALHGFDCYSMRPVTEVLTSQRSLDDKILQIHKLFETGKLSAVKKENTYAT